MEDYKILLIEDEKQMAMYIQMELTHEGYSVEVEYDGTEGFKRAEKQEDDMILLDVMLPGLNGMEVCKKIRQFSSIPIIMLTAKGEITDRVMGLDLGADDYLTKPFAIEELLARIRVIRRKDKEKTTFNELRVDNLVMNNEFHQVKKDGKTIELTKKEYELLEILLKNKNIVLTREQLIEKVWGYVYVGDTKVVDVFISYLRSKIDDTNENKIITTVRGVGYVIKTDKS